MIQRYDAFIHWQADKHMEHFPEGRWVKYDDHVAEVERLRNALEDVAGEMIQDEYDKDWCLRLIREALANMSVNKNYIMPGQESEKK